MPKQPKETELGRYLRRWRKAQRLSMRALEEQSGVSHGTISNVELGKSAPDNPTLVRLAEAMGEPLDRLTSLAARDQKSPAAGLGRASHDGEPGPTLGRQAAPLYFTMVPQSVRRDAPLLVKDVPFFQQRVSASQPAPREPERMLPVAVPRDGKYVAVRVSGECMLPKIEPEDIVIVDTEYPPRPGDVCLIDIDNEWTLKRMTTRDDDRWEFRPDNPRAGEPVVAKPYAVTVVGVVIAVQSGKP